MIKIINTVFFTSYMKAVKGINPKSSHYKGKKLFFCFFDVVSIR